MLFTSLKRAIKFGWKNFLQQRETLLPTIFVLFLVTFLVGFFVIGREVGFFLIEKIKERTDIAIYFKEEVEEEKILEVEKKLSTNPQIKKIEYISKEKALEIFKKRHEKDPFFVETLTLLDKNPFLASLNIVSQTPMAYEEILSFLEKEKLMDLVDHTSYPTTKLVIERIFYLTKVLKKVVITLAFIFSAIAIFVNFNTIKLAILNLKEEIELQKTVGASGWFIQAPFLIESILCAILASFFSFLTIFFICRFLEERAKEFLLGISIYQIFLEQILKIIVLKLIVGILVASISTLIVTRRYLKS